jgi:hypothetical protein
MSASWLPTASQRVARAGTDTLPLTIAMLARHRAIEPVGLAVYSGGQVWQVSLHSDADAWGEPDDEPLPDDWEEDDDDGEPLPRVRPRWWEEFGTDFDDDEPEPEPGDFWPDEDDRDELLQGLPTSGCESKCPRTCCRQTRLELASIHVGSGRSCLVVAGAKTQ